VASENFPRLQGVPATQSRANRASSNQSQLSNAFLTALLEAMPNILGISECLVANYSEKWRIQVNDFLPLDSIRVIERDENNLKSQPLSGDAKLLLGIYGGIRGAARGQDPLAEQICGLARLLRESDALLFLVPSLYRALQQSDIVASLRNEGFSITGIINTPPNFNRLQRPTAFLLIKRGTTETAIALDHTSAKGLPQVMKNVVEGIDTGEIRTGVSVSPEKFRGFEHWYVAREAEGLRTDFGNYGQVPLGELAHEINRSENGYPFEHLAGSIYIPKTPGNDVVTEIAHLSMTHDKYFQLVLNEDRSLAVFVANYLNTHHVRRYLEAEKSAREGSAQQLSMQQVMEVPITLPDIETQRQIEPNIIKLDTLREYVTELIQHVSLRPSSSESMLRQVNDALEVFEKLSAADQILALVRDGESQFVEFKASFSLPIEPDGPRNDDKAKQKKPPLEPRQLQKSLEESALKTIVAFLNCDGGDLLIGVKDNKTINGVNDEIKQLRGSSTDKFLLYFGDKVRERIGAGWLTHVKHTLVEIDGRFVLRVRCEQSDEPAYLDGDFFFVRNSPSTQQLKGQEANRFIKGRFQ
jgi:hypothetical protein